MFTPDDSHLEPLLACGLGTGRPSAWRRRLGAAYPSLTEMVGEQLRYAAAQGFVARVRLLLEHGVDTEATGYHPMFGDRTAFELAVRHGQFEVATLLQAAGASVGRVDPVDRLVGAALNDDSRAVARLREADHGLVERASERHPGLVRLAVEQGRLPALPLLLSLGLDVNGSDRFGATGLHQAALEGKADAVEWLLNHRGDPSRRDRRFHATPGGWAAHGGYPELAARLDVLAPPG